PSCQLSIGVLGAGLFSEKGVWRRRVGPDLFGGKRPRAWQECCDEFPAYAPFLRGVSAGATGPFGYRDVRIRRGLLQAGFGRPASLLPELQGGCESAFNPSTIDQQRTTDSVG